MTDALYQQLLEEKTVIGIEMGGHILPDGGYLLPGRQRFHEIAGDGGLCRVLRPAGQQRGLPLTGTAVVEQLVFRVCISQPPGFSWHRSRSNFRYAS